MNTLLYFNDVSLGYTHRPVVHHLTGHIPEGAFLAIVGPNGAGKSTLLKAIAGILHPLKGRIILNKKHGTQDIAYLQQQTELDSGFPINVHDFTAMGLWRRVGAFGSIDRTMRAQISETLKRVGLNDLASRPIGTLSGGQMQRALFARLALQDSSLILLDEPFSALDEHTTQDLIQLIKYWHREGRTIIAVLHDLDLIRRHIPHTLILAHETVAWGETNDVLGQDTHVQKAHRLMRGSCRSGANDILTKDAHESL